MCCLWLAASRRAFKAKAPDWTVLHLSQFLPMNVDRPGATKFQLRIAAVIMLKLLGKSEHIQTNRLRPLFLRSSLALSKLREAATRWNQAWTRDDVLIVLAKHGIHRARLLQRRAVDAVEKAMAFFQPLGIDIVLCYGRLLGAVRDQGFIPHDDDIDFLILNGATSRADADAKTADILRLMTEKKIASWDGGENILATFHGRSLDVFICWEQGDKIELMMEHYRYRTIDKAILTPTSEITFYGRAFPAPGRPKAFLVERYGNGWATPDPYCEFPWPIEGFDQPLPGPAAWAFARRPSPGARARHAGLWGAPSWSLGGKGSANPGKPRPRTRCP